MKLVTHELGRGYKSSNGMKIELDEIDPKAHCLQIIVHVGKKRIRHSYFFSPENWVRVQAQASFALMNTSKFVGMIDHANKMDERAKKQAELAKRIADAKAKVVQP